MISRACGYPESMSTVIKGIGTVIAMIDIEDLT